MPQAGANRANPGSGSVSLYHGPVICLDYASLNPSVFIGHHMCYSTHCLGNEPRVSSREVLARDRWRTSPSPAAPVALALLRYYLMEPRAIHHELAVAVQ
jgi:hypothetical protein